MIYVIYLAIISHIFNCYYDHFIYQMENSYVYIISYISGALIYKWSLYTIIFIYRDILLFYGDSWLYIFVS